MGVNPFGHQNVVEHPVVIELIARMEASEALSRPRK